MVGVVKVDIGPDDGEGVLVFIDIWTTGVSVERVYHFFFRLVGLRLTSRDETVEIITYEKFLHFHARHFWPW